MADETPTDETAERAGDAGDATGAAVDTSDAAVDATGALGDEQAALAERVRDGLGPDAVLGAADAHGTLVVRITLEAWARAAAFCKQTLGCDYLSFVSGIDWMPAPVIAEEGSGDTSAPVQPREQTAGVAGAAGRFQVFAHVESTRRARFGLKLKADVDEADPRVPSWVDTYPGADWHERECWEMFGFVFDGHPALRHLYLPSGFEGHPGRKDYPLLAREVKPWPGLVDVEGMPGEASDDATGDSTADATTDATAEGVEA